MKVKYMVEDIQEMQRVFETQMAPRLQYLYDEHKIDEADWHYYSCIFDCENFVKFETLMAKVLKRQTTIKEGYIQALNDVAVKWQWEEIHTAISEAMDEADEFLANFDIEWENWPTYIEDKVHENLPLAEKVLQNGSL